MEVIQGMASIIVVEETNVNENSMNILKRIGWYLLLTGAPVNTGRLGKGRIVPPDVAPLGRYMSLNECNLATCGRKGNGALGRGAGVGGGFCGGGG